mmetsp:Transcript_30495/g.98527  ORF Transcript_30495/g.98527 Transcript_30495/m.98527 type:complete len:274 (-) Transcript_30495:16-837(-)
MHRKERLERFADKLLGTMAGQATPRGIRVYDLVRRRTLRHKLGIRHLTLQRLVESSGQADLGHLRRGGGWSASARPEAAGRPAVDYMRRRPPAPDRLRTRHHRSRRNAIAEARMERCVSAHAWQARRMAASEASRPAYDCRYVRLGLPKVPQKMRRRLQPLAKDGVDGQVADKRCAIPAIAQQPNNNRASRCECLVENLQCLRACLWSGQHLRRQTQRRFPRVAGRTAPGRVDVNDAIGWLSLGYAPPLSGELAEADHLLQGRHCGLSRGCVA